MCGIAGIIAPDVRSYREPLERMVEALGYRRPDGSRSFFFICGLCSDRVHLP
ncbi:MAG: hypothetical protein HYS12_14180 [Planctomycetes bacterium]|nr:hypothetical protein [Planctomycetota bacterium]